MVIELREDGLFDEDKMTVEETRVFIMFLTQEKARHQEDIDKIDATVTKLEATMIKKVDIKCEK